MSGSRRLLLVLVAVALVFFILQFQRFGGLHRKISLATEEADQSIDCQHKQRALVDDVARLKDEVDSLNIKLMEAEERGGAAGGRDARGGGGAARQSWNKHIDNIVSAVETHQSHVAAGGGQTRAGAAQRSGEPRRRDSQPWHEPLTCNMMEGDHEGVVAAVVVMSCSRPLYLQRTMDNLLMKWNRDSSYKKKFPLFISQDGPDIVTKAAVNKYARMGVTSMFHPWREATFVRTFMERPKENIAYYRIAAHYRFALGQLFECARFPLVLILEDDMEISVDFFDYFEGLSKILHRDPTLLAVSSWNDNGQVRFVSDPEAVYRSDFFPGLGWMMRREVWVNEFVSSWPRAYWDDWIRLHEVRKGRQVIRPEVCRTFNFGEKGSNSGQFYKEYLATIRLNDVPVTWTQKDLGYLVDETYWNIFSEIIRSAPHAQVPADIKTTRGDFVIYYDSHKAFDELAKHFGIFREWKEGMPRTSYQGVVIFRMGNVRVFITPRNFKPPPMARPDGTRPYIGPIYPPMPLPPGKSQ